MLDLFPVIIVDQDFGIGMVNNIGGMQMKLEPGKKRAIRKMIRTAIKFQNSRTLFSCNDCCFCSGSGCDLGEDVNVVVQGLRMPHQLPECFILDPLGTAFAGCLDLMKALGVDSFKSINGWGTVVGRLLSLTHIDNYGYIINVKQRNLNRYG